MPTLILPIPKGQIALPFVLFISGIIVEIAIAGAFVAYLVSSTSLGEKLSVRSYTTAYAGLQDAMIKITRNKNHCTSTCASTLTVGSDTASLTVTRTSDNSNSTYTYTINSVGSAGTGAPRKKELKATMIVHQLTGEVILQSIIDQPTS